MLLQSISQSVAAVPRNPENAAAVRVFAAITLNVPLSAFDMPKASVTVIVYECLPADKTRDPA